MATLFISTSAPNMRHERNPNYLHHRPDTITMQVLAEIVFGMEDGMVSTLGAITGIAAGTRHHFTVVLSGLVIVAVESISMAVGSYLSNKSEKEVEERKLHEEKLELRDFPQEEKKELVGLYRADGWSENLATEMAEEASKNETLFLQEMAYRELKIIPEKTGNPLQKGVAMGLSYVVGGSIPLLPYAISPSLGIAIPLSVVITLLGLFILGTFTSKYSKRVWWKAGLEMLGLASAAAVVGYGVGTIADRFLR